MESKAKEYILVKKELLFIKDGSPVYNDKFQMVNRWRIGRNDDCPICFENGIGIKFKKCKEHYETLS